MKIRRQWHLHLRVFLAITHGTLPGVCKSASSEALTASLLAKLEKEVNLQTVVFKQNCMGARGRVGELRLG